MALADWLRPPIALPGPVAPAVDARRGWLRTFARALGIGVDSVFVSSQTGLGVYGTDQGSTWQVRPRPILSYQTIDTLYRQHALARRVVDVLPDAALASPWRLDDAERRDVAAELDEAIGMRTVVRQWWSRARLHGACLAVPYFEGQGPDLSKPMPAGTRGKCTAVQTFSGEEVSVLAYDLDPGSPNFGRPLIFAVTPMVPGAVVSATIHWTRAVWLGSGMYLPPLLRQQYPNSTDLPVLEAYWMALGHRWRVDASAANLSARMVEGVLSFPNLAGVNGAAPDVTGNADAPSGTANEIAREFARASSVVGVGVIDDTMTYQRHAAALTGFADVDATSRREASYVEGIPQREIFGDEPGGLGNNGEGAGRQWNRKVESARQSQIGPGLMALYRLIYGTAITDARLVWEPLERPSALEVAQIRQAHAAADAAYVAAGILTPEEPRQRWTGPEYLEELTLDEDAGDFEAALLGEPVEGAEPVAPGAETIQETALNGAQIASAVEIVTKVAAGELPRDSGVAMLQQFFSLAPATSERLMGSVGRGFVATNEPTATDADDYAIPDAAKGNAAKALRWREEHGDAVQGGTSTGWARARQLAAGGRVSADDVVTIAAWWARHRDNAREPDAEYADEPWRDAGYVAGLLWGGKSGDAWATEARKAIE